MQLKNKTVVRHSQHEFIKVKSCLSYLISLHDNIIHLVDEGMVVDVVFLDLSKAFDTIPHSSLLDKLTSSEINRSILFWAMNWLNSSPQRLIAWGATSS